MSRFYLIPLLFLLPCSCRIFAQNKLGQYIKFGDEKYRSGDFVYALDMYQKALEIDSNAIEINWKYAEALRAYKDYVKAEYYYHKVYSRENMELFPMSLLYLGTMQKHNSKYSEAINSFKNIVSRKNIDRNSYVYRKAAREIESCLWAISNVKDTLSLLPFVLPETINTADSEFGSTFHNGHFIYSSLHADSTGNEEVVYAKKYHTYVYQAMKEKDSFSTPKRIEEFVFDGMSSGNGTYSLDGKRFYFSLCKDANYHYACKIMVAELDSNKWSKLDSLGEIINVPGANTTMPHIALFKGKETLFFASDRNGGSGGLDLYYAEITDGNQYGNPVNLKEINSPDNELSPWFFNDTLFFSSSWHNGFGGYDVSYSVVRENQFTQIKNAGIPINSPTNDLYFFKYHDTLYVTSNRLGVHFEKGPTCCSDIFAFVQEKPLIDTNTTTTTTTITTTTTTLFENLPVTLYFHNDRPNPKTYDSITRINYMDSYVDYKKLTDLYKAEYAKNFMPDSVQTAEEKIDEFFRSKVDKGVLDLEIFKRLLLAELQKGARLNVVIGGFASPLAPTGYNVRLTKRRIMSVMNYFEVTDDAVFAPYLWGTAENGGLLTISKEPFGEYRADKSTSDNYYDQKKSVYSPEAAMERKVEIKSVDYLEEDTLAYVVKLDKRMVDLGAVKTNSLVSFQLKIKNIGLDTLRLSEIKNTYFIAKNNFDKILTPGEEVEVIFTRKSSMPKGLFHFNSQLFFVGYQKPIYLPIVGEGL